MKSAIHERPENIALMAHIIHHVQKCIRNESSVIRKRHEQKLQKWADRQDSPICKIENTIKLIGDVSKPPDYVIETLKYGPRHPVLTKFDEKDVLCEMDMFLEYCERYDK